MKKLNKQLLSEELEKFKLINEYNFYVGEELETADDLLLDEDDEEEASDPLADEIDDLPADDSKSNSGDEESEGEDDLDIDSLEADIDTDEEGDIDSLEADIEGALNIGMNAIHFIAHGEDHHSKCKIIHDLDELLNFL